VILDRSIIGNHISDPNTSTDRLPRAAFAPADPAIHSIDDLVPRNAFYSPGTKNVDLALAKNFRMPYAGHNLAVKLEAFNAFNQVKFGFPNNDITSVNFGRLTGAPLSGYSARQLQLVLRYRY
jgi:hypothetical protein